MKKNFQIRVLIVAGGTGGHLFPALYIAKAFEHILKVKIDQNAHNESSSFLMQSSCKIQFIGSGRELEKKIVDAAGYTRHCIDIVGIKRLGVKGIFRFIVKFPKALVQTLHVLKNFKPHIIIGVGGYVTVLPVLIATISGIPTWIHEAEREPGLANKLLGYFVDKISVAYNQTVFRRRSKVMFTGQPLRPEIVKTDFSKVTLNSPPHLLIMGGSQGSDAIDKAAAGIAYFLRKGSWKVLHQCRAENIDFLIKKYREHGIEAEVTPFIDQVEKQLVWADLVISRGGASAVLEIQASMRAAVIVPLPGALEQRLNAEPLTQSSQGIVVEEGEGIQHRLIEAIDKLCLDSFYDLQSEKRTSFDQNLSERRDAAVLIAKACLELVQQKFPVKADTKY
jgi:UDP-N-acetylglucosamine--N-acetylmuramyl-(pentapeptide) pyrophosphoryl-undecaprenol N-acetylglucosamine transferase